MTGQRHCYARVKHSSYDPFDRRTSRACHGTPNIRDRATGRLYCPAHKDRATDPEPLNKQPVVTPRDLPFILVISEHAKKRMRERFPDVKPARMVDEVRLAFRERRFSGKRPPGFLGRKPEHYGFFAWTPDGQRIYAMRTNDQVVTVTTVVRAGVRSDL